MPDGLLESRLASYLAAHPSHSSFDDRRVDYHDRFRRVAEYLNAHVHPHVTIGAMARSKVWLNDHGSDHVAMVVRRAGDLLFQGEGQWPITPYEAFILLLAIHFHDVGNYLGRSRHEERIDQVMRDLGSEFLGGDSIEQRMIKDVAMAHGGTRNGSMDTIGQLSYERTTPNVFLLAAILRFADELADDYSRTSRFLIKQDTKALYKGSEAYHHYSAALRRVTIDSTQRRIELRFELPADLTSRKLAKNDSRVFLFDEIRARLTKVHSEHLYCSQFWMRSLRFESIDAKIGVYEDELKEPLWHTTYSLKHRGYGYPATQTLEDACPTLSKVTGVKLKKVIERRLSPTRRAKQSGRRVAARSDTGRERGRR